jgi:hypothetical protein
MPTTNYYNIGGAIVSQVTSGTRVDYLRDAFGSTTATVSQSGSVQESLQYKPYGSLLTSSGSGGIPDLTYRGARLEHNVADGSPGSLFFAWHHLYPSIASDFATVFNRSWQMRTFWGGQPGQLVPVCGSTAAPWATLTAQPIWIDSNYSVAATLLHSPCFATEQIGAIWQMPCFNKSSASGIIAQQLTTSMSLQTCRKQATCNQCVWPNNTFSYVESWPVSRGGGATQSGHTVSSRANCINAPTVCWYDLYGWGGCASCIRGSLSVVGTSGYYDGCEATIGQLSGATSGGKNLTWANGSTSLSHCPNPWTYLSGLAGVPASFPLGPTTKSLTYNTDCCYFEPANSPYTYGATWSDSRASNQRQYSQVGSGSERKPKCP